MNPSIRIWLGGTEKDGYSIGIYRNATLLYHCINWSTLGTVTLSIAALIQMTATIKFRQSRTCGTATLTVLTPIVS